MTSEIPSDLLDLHRAAERVRDRAYAPYSGFAVGAALLGSDGTRYLGVNVENLSYSVTMCAERVALGAALAAGCRDFAALAIAATGGTVSPCGACRQALAEFAPELPVVFPVDDALEVMTLAELLPVSFQTEMLARPEAPTLTTVA